MNIHVDIDNDQVQDTGLYYGVMGIVGVIILFGMYWLSKWIKDIYLLNFGLILMFIGCALLIGNNLSLIQFTIGAGIIWSIGYPMAQTIIISMFSKLIKVERQGMIMGLIGTAGSLGRICGPIISGYIYTFGDQFFTFIFATFVSGLAVLTSLGSWKYLSTIPNPTSLQK